MQEMRGLPELVTNLESQILQLRQEMRVEFSATRSEFRNELVQAVTTLHGALAAAVTTLSQAIAETNTHMRVLHEDTLSGLRQSAKDVSRRKSGRSQASGMIVWLNGPAIRS